MSSPAAPAQAPSSADADKAPPASPAPPADSTSSPDAAPGSPSTAAAPPASAPPMVANAASSTYLLQPYDLIDVDVYNEEDLHKPARLGADGTALLPLIGSVKLSDLTVAQATDLVRDRYATGFVKNPNVMITVLQYRRSTYSILGQVVRPGVYEIQEGAHVNIIEAVSQAGGYTALAGQNSISVKRTVDGTPQTIKVKAADMAQNAEVTPFELLAGDTVLVPSAQYQKNDFSILGQVQRPGVYAIPSGAHMTIIDAVSLAGGFSPMAAQNSISVKRAVEDKTSILKVKASDMVQNPDVPPFEVLPGDIVLVPFRNSAFSILGQVSRPGIYEIPEGAHVNIIDAILMAGGFTRTAAQNSVTVKRTLNGKPELIKVKAGKMAQDPDMLPFEVEPGDIIKVNESWY